MQFSKFCLDTRLKLNLSQEMLARKLDVSFATINRWENGKALPQKLTLYRFEKFCEETEIKGKRRKILFDRRWIAPNICIFTLSFGRKRRT